MQRSPRSPLRCPAEPEAIRWASSAPQSGSARQHGSVRVLEEPDEFKAMAKAQIRSAAVTADIPSITTVPCATAARDVGDADPGQHDLVGRRVEWALRP